MHLAAFGPRRCVCGCACICASRPALFLVPRRLPRQRIHKFQINGVRRRPYRVECTGPHPTSEVKRRRARLVLGWGTAREDLRVLSAFSHARLALHMWKAHSVLVLESFLICALASGCCTAKQLEAKRHSQAAGGPSPRALRSSDFRCALMRTHARAWQRNIFVWATLKHSVE